MTRRDYSNEEKKCTVSIRDVPEEYFAEILEMQKGLITSNTREGKKTAFEKAKEGSALFLESRGIVK